MVARAAPASGRAPAEERRAHDQTGKGLAARNDRLMGVPETRRIRPVQRDLGDLPPRFLAWTPFVDRLRRIQGVTPACVAFLGALGEDTVTEAREPSLR